MSSEAVLGNVVPLDCADAPCEAPANTIAPAIMPNIVRFMCIFSIENQNAAPQRIAWVEGSSFAAIT